MPLHATPEGPWPGSRCGYEPRTKWKRPLAAWGQQGAREKYFLTSRGAVSDNHDCLVLVVYSDVIYSDVIWATLENPDRSDAVAGWRDGKTA